MLPRGSGAAAALEPAFHGPGVAGKISAMSTRDSFEEFEAEQVANLIADVLDAPGDETVVARVREQARALCRRFPVYAQAGAPVEKAA